MALHCLWLWVPSRRRLNRARWEWHRWDDPCGYSVSSAIKTQSFPITLMNSKKNIHFFGIVYTSSACFSSKFGCWNNLPIVKSADENSLDDESGVVTTGVLGVVGSIVDGAVCLTDWQSSSSYFFFSTERCAKTFKFLIVVRKVSKHLTWLRLDWIFLWALLAPLL